MRMLGLGVGICERVEGLDVGPGEQAARKARASSVPRTMMEELMTMRPWRWDSLGTQRAGKVGPKSGMRAPEMWAQNVAQTARAHG